VIDSYLPTAPPAMRGTIQELERAMADGDRAVGLLRDRRGPL
jgi:hypothetical protein